MKVSDIKLRTKIKNTFTDWILDSTSHGFPKIFKTNRGVLKAMWIICLCSSIGMCAYLISRTLIDYFQYDVTTKVRKISQIPMEFPALSICNSESFVTENGKEFVQNIMKLNGIDDILNSTFFSTYFKQKYQEVFNLVIFNHFARLYTLDYKQADEFRRNLGYKIEDFLVNCYVGAQACRDEDFIWYFDQNYGNCYLFNTGYMENGSSIPIYQQSDIGTYNSLRLEFLIRNVHSISISKGIHITFFDPKTKVNTIRGFDIAPKFISKMVLNKKVNTKIPYPYSECLIDQSEFQSSEIYQATLNVSETYSKDICYGICFQNYLINNCGCTDPTKPFFKPIPNCLNLTQIFCDFIYFKKFFTELDVKDICSKDCPLECERTTYEHTMSLLEYPTDIQAKAIYKLMSRRNLSVENLTLNEIKDNSVLLIVGYDELEYETIEEIKQMEIVDLISNIGGIMGLFIGISILSFAELIEICIEFVYVCFESKKKNKVIEVKSQNP